MKTITAITLFLLALTQGASAGPGRPGDFARHHERHMERMIGKLQLTDTQQPVVRQILEEQRGKLRSEIEAIRAQVKPRMEALQAETRQRLSSVLDEEQLQKFDTLVEQRREKIEERRQRGWKRDGAGASGR